MIPWRRSRGVRTSSVLAVLLCGQMSDFEIRRTPIAFGDRFAESAAAPHHHMTQQPRCFRAHRRGRRNSLVSVCISSRGKAHVSAAQPVRQQLRDCTHWHQRRLWLRRPKHDSGGAADGGRRQGGGPCRSNSRCHRQVARAVGLSESRRPIHADSKGGGQGAICKPFLLLHIE